MKKNYQMKKISFFRVYLIICLTSIKLVQAQSGSSSSCCSKPATTEFAMLGSNEAFKASHLAPQPFRFISTLGKMIALKSADGKDASGFEIKSVTPTKNYLFVIQEWWGLNDYIIQEAQNLSEELGNVNVIALDLYDGKVATNPDDASAFMKEAKETRIRTIIQAFLDYAGQDAQVQTIGWCFGGGWSLQTSLMAGKSGAGCVLYYGMPENDQEKLKKLNAPVLAIFATKDQWITPAVALAFEKDMKSLGKKITVKSYDADHAFANPSNPKFNKEAMEDAHGVAVSFLREHIK